MTKVIHKIGVTNYISSIPIKKQIKMFSIFGFGIGIHVQE